MGENTKIEWAHHTFNPWIGCTKVSPACDHCYAEALMDKRYRVVQWGGQRKRTSESTWKRPLGWNGRAKHLGERHRVFCASLADVFDNQVPAQWRRDLFALIDMTHQLDWLLLTKRPQNIAKMLDAAIDKMPGKWPWPNVWLGTTVENQEEATRRIPHLLAVPARVHFLSCEPLLAPIDLRPYLGSNPAHCGNGLRDRVPNGVEDCQNGSPRQGIGWTIVGGESGPHARPMHPDWARSLRDQCADAGVAFHFKQWGEWHPNDHAIVGDIGHTKVGKARAGRILDGRTHDEFPVAA